MPDQALFAYRVQLPDGSETVRTGGADRPPTHGELADYAANQGERYLGPVAMSPNIPTGSPPPEAAPTPSPAAPTVPPPAPPEAVASPSTLSHTLWPERSIASQVPSIVGGVGGGMLAGAGMGALGGPLAPITVPVGAIIGGALGSGGLEYLTAKSEQEAGIPPSEEGTPAERAVRAGVRGGVGETGSQLVQGGAQAVKALARPVLSAVEQVAPTITRELPAEATAVTTKVGQLIRDPGALATAPLGPQGQRTMLPAWWQYHTANGADAVVKAWDALTPVGQLNLAGPQVDAMGRIVDALRPSGMGIGSLAKSAGLPATLSHYGVISYPTAVGLTAATRLGQEYAPRALLYPTALDWMSRLPPISRVASPWASAATSTVGQIGAREALP
jgi:hypothetical protein